MATYTELFALRSDSALQNKVAVAVMVKAQKLLDGATPTADQVAWSKTALEDPLSMAGKLLNYVLAANNAQTVAVITGATDAAIQANVDAAADALIAGAPA